MKSPLLTLCTLLLSGLMLQAQPSNDSLNLVKLIHFPTSDWNVPVGNGKCNDIWGYADSSGAEYALVGNEKGTLVAHLSPFQQAIPALWVPGATSVWRDLKTWSHYAYVVHDATPNNPDGLLIIDMDSLAQSRYRFVKPTYTNPVTGIVDTFQKAHNIFVDENGILYAFGSNIGTSGGAVMIDVATDPWNPSIVGVYEGDYFHDGYARNDTLWGAALWGGVIVVDVTYKSSPLTIATFATPGSFAHNCWLSDDGNTLYTTDEIADGFIAGFDVSNLSNVNEYFRVRPQVGTGVIPHNAHVDGQHLVTSYYTFGVHILDVEYPELPVLAAYYDSSPVSGGGFFGAWGAYPYLPSNRLLVTDREEGLFVLEADYPDVSRLKLTVGTLDLSTGSTAWGALPGHEMLYWKSGGDSLYVDSLSHQVLFYGLNATNDTLMWNYAPGQNLAVHYTLSSGMFPHDTLIGQIGLSLEDLTLPSFDVWTGKESWALHGLEGHQDLRIQLIDANGQVLRQFEWQAGDDMVVPFPLSPGAYWIRYESRQGESASVSVIRP